MVEKIWKIFKDDRTTRSMIWITKEEFKLLEPTFALVDKENEIKRRRTKERIYGWRKSILETSEHRLFFILYYLKVYPTYDEWWVAWWTARCVIWDWICKYFPILQESLKRLWVIPPETKEDFQERFWNSYEKKYIFIDWSERNVSRSTNYSKQKKFYSGKKNNIQ